LENSWTGDARRTADSSLGLWRSTRTDPAGAPLRPALSLPRSNAAPSLVASASTSCIIRLATMMPTAIGRRCRGEHRSRRRRGGAGVLRLLRVRATRTACPRRTAVSRSGILGAGDARRVNSRVLPHVHAVGELCLWMGRELMKRYVEQGAEFCGAGRSLPQPSALRPLRFSMSTRLARRWADAVRVPHLPGLLGVLGWPCAGATRESESRSCSPSERAALPLVTCQSRRGFLQVRGACP
jgi:hypothetical protein